MSATPPRGGGDRWLRGLNPEQRQAAATIRGPLLVLAGAGSGKTRVITHRIAHLIARGAAPASICALTFTNKAAGEMAERLRAMVGAAADEVTLSTFHSLGLRILKEELSRRRRGARLSIFDTGDQLGVLKEICRRLRLDRGYDLGAILTRISRFKNAFLTPDRVPEGADPYHQAAAMLYPRYEELLEAYAAVDFDDLVVRPARMLAEDDGCRGRWGGRFAHLLVDEYQDTNGAQLRLLKGLAAGAESVCVVGDDDQAIYGWRGADVRNILRFRRDFPGAEVVYLERNYRSVGAVLALANAIIAENPERHEKVLRPARGEGERPRLVLLRDGETEASWVAGQVKRALGEGLGPEEIAVLFRSTLTARELEGELRAHGVDYRMLGGTAFYEAREVKDLIAYLRVCHNRADELSLRRVINVPPRGIGPRTVARLAAHAEARGIGFHRALGEAEAIFGAGDRAARAVGRFAALVAAARRDLARGGDLSGALRRLVAAIGLEEDIRKGPGSPQAADRRWGNVQGFINSLAAYERKARQPSLGEFLGLISLASADDDPGGEARGKVTLSTLHGAKGLEWPLVFILGVEEGLLPHRRTLNPHAQDDPMAGGADIPEERRLLYVGVTRARDRLVLTRCLTRVVRGRAQEQQPSRFLEPAGEEVLEQVDRTAPPAKEDLAAMMAALRAQLGG